MHEGTPEWRAVHDQDIILGFKDGSPEAVILLDRNGTPRRVPWWRALIMIGHTQAVRFTRRLRLGAYR